MNRTVTLVNEQGSAIGEADILDAHTGEGKLHRAFSVFVFSPDKSMLMIQKRSKEKMLWPLIWANTCCSHPLKDETPVQAGQRRLKEELGFTCELHEGPSFVYRAQDGARGVEHEHDTILLGTANKDIIVKPNPAEVAEWKWIARAELAQAMKNHPDDYAPWLHIGLPLIKK